MRRRVNTAVALAAAATVVGLFLVFASRARQAAALTQCGNNLRQLAFACIGYQDVNRRFPGATVVASRLPPDKRLSWITEVFPCYVINATGVFDPSQPWDSDVNHPPWCSSRQNGPGPHTVYTCRMNRVVLFSCPANPWEADEKGTDLTNILGVAGLGRDAAALPLADPRAGFFGYDRTLTPAGIKGGLSATAMLIESADGGPWIAGGHATVRGFELDRRPYFGADGQFVTAHWKGWPWARGPGLANVALADCSARPINGTASSGVLRAMMTVAGGEPPDFPDD